MGSKFTIEFCKEYALQRGYEVLSDKYESCFEKLKFKHLEDNCNYVFDMDFHHFKNGKNGCLKCSGKTKLTIEYCQEYANERGFTILDENVINAKEKIRFRHDTPRCDYYVSDMTWNAFYSKDGGCKKCSRKLSPNEEEINRFSRECDYECLNSGAYVNQYTCLVFEHLLCGTVFEKNWKDFKRNIRCTRCTSSDGENRIEDFLSYNNIICKKEKYFDDCRSILPLPFDFGIPCDDETWFLIEFHGIQHYKPVDFAGKGIEWAKSEFKKRQINDKIKLKYCQDNNIPLLVIPYWEFDNIENILTEKLLS